MLSDKRTAEKMYGTMLLSWSKLLTEGARSNKAWRVVVLALGRRKFAMASRRNC
jgi:hypothetical protein